MKHLPTRREVLASLTAAVSGLALAAARSYGQSSPAGALAAANSANTSSVSRAPPQPLSVPEYELLARARMSHPAREYIDSGSADEFTVQWNREALVRMRLQPRVMIDVSKIDTTISLLGKKLPHPILLAPTAAHMLVDTAGEVATVRGAGAADAVMVASTLSNRSIEEINAAATRPVWFQLYVAKDRELTKAMIQRAEAAGCQALCITADLPVVYGRNRVARVEQDMPPLPFPNLNISATVGWRGIRNLRSSAFNWRDIEWLQSFVRTPILLKGVLHPADADEAVKCGVAGIVVSNHGGRGLDSVPATIDALPRVVDRIAKRIPVLMDGGIRRGTDVLKAIGLGATAVLIGRPYLYGLAVNGAEGVRHVIEILRTEFETAMALTGRTSIAAIDRSVLWAAENPASPKLTHRMP